MRKALDLATIKRFESDAKRLGVSVVARSPRGFMAAFRRAGGKISRLSPHWKKKRENFIKRHYAQVLKRKEPLFRNGCPTRRHLALIFWAWSPTPRKLKKKCTVKARKTRPNPYKNYKYRLIAPKNRFDKRSFRTVKSGARSLVRVACPRGKWQPRKKLCRVGMRAQEVLTRKNPFDLKKVKQLKLLKPKKPFYRYDQKQLQAGIRVEMEHTKDRSLAAIIAANHLDEMPDYYTRLKRMERRNPEVEYHSRSNKYKGKTYMSIGHDGDATLWIYHGGKILTKDAYPEDKEEETHDSAFGPGHFWQGRYESSSETLSILPPYGSEERKVPVKILNLLISEFHPKRIYAFF